MSPPAPPSGNAFLTSRAPLRPQHAAAALLQLSDGRYVMQLRDSNPDIFYPEHWGFFGGALDAGESPLEAIRRELDEELGLKVSEQECHFFTEFTFDFGFAGLGRFNRHYYAIRLAACTTGGFRLTEGAAVDAFSAEKALAELRMVPYNSFAIWMHNSRDRLAI